MRKTLLRVFCVTWLLAGLRFTSPAFAQKNPQIRVFLRETDTLALCPSTVVLTSDNVIHMGQPYKLTRRADGSTGLEVGDALRWVYLEAMRGRKNSPTPAEFPAIYPLDVVTGDGVVVLVFHETGVQERFKETSNGLAAQLTLLANVGEGAVGKRLRFEKVPVWFLGDKINGHSSGKVFSGVSLKHSLDFDRAVVDGVHGFSPLVAAISPALSARFESEGKQLGFDRRHWYIANIEGIVETLQGQPFNKFVFHITAIEVPTGNSAGKPVFTLRE